jgi:two-component system, sensor histidine kinase and response regulator
MKKKILIIDDDNTTVALLTMRLEHSGFDVSSANNGKDGLEKIHEEKPDLVLLDGYMPVMDGFETCRLAKQDEKIKHIPIIFLTSDSQETHIEKSKKAGADGYITRPCQGLDEIIKEYLKE